MTMASQTTRKMLVEFLEVANVSGVRDNARIEQFIEGDCDVDLADLQLDSLGTMEFCIAIEVNCGISIVPDSILGMGSLGQLAEVIEGGLP